VGLVFLTHLIFNAVWLLAFGSPVARRFGPLRFLAFTATTAAAGAAVHLVTHFREIAADDRRIGRLGSISMAGVEQAIAWQPHIGGFLADLLAFAAFDPIPISTGAGPNEGMDAPPPAINLDTIAGCALLAMPRRSTRGSACAAKAVLVVIPARGGHHLVQTA
jgi:hypothetical protein